MQKITFSFFLFWLLSANTTNSFAQNIQWASKVRKYSSQLSKDDYSVDKILGTPNVMPQGGYSPNAWTPEKDDDKQFVEVSFKTPIRIQQIIIAENHNPGAIKKIFVYDTDGKQYVVSARSPAVGNLKKRTLNIYLPLTQKKIEALRLELNCGAVAGVQQIDAIGISALATPVKVGINQTADLNVSPPTKLSTNVNSSSEEIGPIVSPDGNTLYFSRRQHPENIGGKEDMEDIWYSSWNPKTKTWSPAKNMGAPLNNASPNFVSAVTPDGNMLLLGNEYKGGDDMSSGVSFSTRNDSGQWAMPQDMKIRRERNESEKVNYFLSNSGKILIISSQRPDSYGGRDLYVSFQNLTGNWSTPENLGIDLNTASDEYSPFLAADERTLYFSSSGHPGYGGDDMFLARRTGEGWTNWTQPENLGKNINTAKNDAYFSLPASGEFAYFTSNTSGTDADVYRVALPTSKRPNAVVLIRGTVYDKKTKLPISAGIQYEDLADGTEKGTAKSALPKGNYQIVLPSGSNYGFRASAPGYIAINDNLDLRKLKNYEEIVRDLYLVPIEIGQVIRINNIFFDFDKSNLKSASNYELNRIVEYLKEYPEMEIQISGHTDQVGTAAYNQKLSQQRAQAVLKYLIDKGISKNRLSAKGYGKTQPQASNKTEKGRQLNRRVEFKIAKK